MLYEGQRSVMEQSKYEMWGYVVSMRVWDGWSGQLRSVQLGKLGLT